MLRNAWKPIPGVDTSLCVYILRGAVQLSACMSANTCTRLHFFHGFTTVSTYCQSTSCTLKVPQQGCVAMVIAPPWMKHLTEPRWQIASISPVPPVSVITTRIPPRTELYQLSPPFCSLSRFLPLSFSLFPRQSAPKDRTHWVKLHLYILYIYIYVDAH